jgi:hypothetical protein
MDGWGWAAALRHQRSDTRSALVERRRTSGLAQDRRPRGGPAALRAPPAPARPCRRARPGRRPAIDNAEIIETVRARRRPMIPVSTSPLR